MTDNGSTYIETPKGLMHKKILNIQNVRDNRCFLYSVVAAILSPSDFNFMKRPPDQKNQKRKKPSTYTPFLRRVKMGDISFPVKLSELPKFERLNPEIAVNVLGNTNLNFKYFRFCFMTHFVIFGRS